MTGRVRTLLQVAALVAAMVVVIFVGAAAIIYVFGDAASGPAQHEHY